MYKFSRQRPCWGDLCACCWPCNVYTPDSDQLLKNRFRLGLLLYIFSRQRPCWADLCTCCWHYTVYTPNSDHCSALGKPISFGASAVVHVVPGVQAGAISVPVAGTAVVLFGPVGNPRWDEAVLGRPLTRVHVHPAPTLLAHHEAAPVELALALVHLAHSLGVVASAAAHDVTAVRAQGGFVARASRRAQRTCVSK